MRANQAPNPKPWTQNSEWAAKMKGKGQELASDVEYLEPAMAIELHNLMTVNPRP